MKIPARSTPGNCGRMGVAPGASGDQPPVTLSTIGLALFGPFALPFEIVSLLLLAAIIGTVVLARRRPAGS